MVDKIFYTLPKNLKIQYNVPQVVVFILYSGNKKKVECIVYILTIIFISVEIKKFTKFNEITKIGKLFRVNSS